MSDYEIRLLVAACVLAFGIAAGAFAHLDWEVQRLRRARRLRRRGGTL